MRTTASASTALPVKGMSKEIFTYEVISGGELPIFDGILRDNLIYQFDIVYDRTDKDRIAADLSAVLSCPLPAHIPSRCSSLYELVQEDGSMLECGEGTYGGIGYVCHTSPDGDIQFLACFEESNPFLKAEHIAGKYRAVNNLGELWLFDCTAPVPLISITPPAARGDWDEAWSSREEIK